MTNQDGQEVPLGLPLGQAAWIPSSRTVLVGVLAPPIAFFLCLAWSYVVGSLLRAYLLGRGMSLSSIGVWATDVPGWLFWMPTGVIGVSLALRSAWSRQWWQALVLVLYYLPALLVTLLACIVFSPASIGDL